jgi:hypothetical protein
MLKWFRSGPPPHQTALAMIGAKPGDRVLFVGAVDAPLIGEVARVTGLNGQTLAGIRADDRPRVEAAAAGAGALVDIVEIAGSDRSPVPHGVTEIDVVVLVVDLGALPLDVRLEAVTDAIRALRPGGRLIVIDGQKKALFGAGKGTAMPADAVVPMLTSVGAQAARALGVADGTTYYEARKSR